jgi:hypothetical protein
MNKIPNVCSNRARVCFVEWKKIMYKNQYLSSLFSKLLRNDKVLESLFSSSLFCCGLWFCYCEIQITKETLQKTTLGEGFFKSAAREKEETAGMSQFELIENHSSFQTSNRKVSSSNPQ